jgi:hypothetical protein
MWGIAGSLQTVPDPGAKEIVGAIDPAAVAREMSVGLSCVFGGEEQIGAGGTARSSAPPLQQSVGNKKPFSH